MTGEKNIFHNDEKLAGVFLPRPMADRLALVSVVKGITKSELMRGFITKGLENEDGDPVLIKSIARKAIASWRSGKSITYEAFKKQIENSLVRKKLSDKHIALVTQEVDKWYETKRTSKGSYE